MSTPELSFKPAAGLSRAGRVLAGLFKKDAVFTASFILAAASCFFAAPRPGYIDMKVLVCLFNLMVVIKAFESLDILDAFAVCLVRRCSDARKVSLVLILLSFFMSMLVTNDVALITFIPLALAIGRKSGMDMLETVILQTLAANIGSALTPMGNPQNLFLYSYYRLSPLPFFAAVGFFSATGFILLLALNRRVSRVSLDTGLERISTGSVPKTAVWAAMFIFIVLSVFNAASYELALVLTVAAALALNPGLVLKADYMLLLTFVCFFVFIGNTASIPAVERMMRTAFGGRNSTYFGSILLSQFISNVPCSVFLSRFTGYWKELLLGVNIGGLGTPVASLASIISYKFYAEENPENVKKYILKFTIYNFASLLLLAGVSYIFLIFT